MEIVLGLVIGAAVGLAAHFALPHRSARGVALAPLSGAAASAVVWTLLTWAGQTTSSPLLWVVAILAPAVTTFALVPLLTRVRMRRDAADRARLGI
ncbi:MAG: putative rane protein [Microbacterium sp.]|jgi:Na+/proline symporter|nr:putative rane protein [Microbacterium sp.]